MRKIAVFIFLSIILTRCGENRILPADQTDRNYFPLAAGNSWVYAPPNDTTSIYEYVISGSNKINGMIYYEYGLSGDAYLSQLKQDTSGRILIRINDQDYVYYDFTLPDSATYSYNPYEQSEGNYYIVTVNRGVSVETPAGVFTDCIDLFFNIPGAIDDEVGYIFAPGVGIVHIYGAWHYEFLKEYNLY